MTTGTLMGVITVIIMACFIGVVLYVFVFRGKKDFEDQANIPLEEGASQARKDERKDEKNEEQQ